MDNVPTKIGRMIQRTFLCLDLGRYYHLEAKIEFEKVLSAFRSFLFVYIESSEAVACIFKDIQTPSRCFSFS